jgi:HD-GYP domain-containing protein (c-di-GMP phosphodiesterase class II)
MVFGRFLGLSRAEVKELGSAGLMQDIGKVHVPSEILSKTCALTPDELHVVQSHVTRSLELLIGQPGFSQSVLSIIAEHHERYDGTGYPQSLAGYRINLRSEMAGMVDTYCAMIRRRSYIDAVSSQKALEMLSRMRGTKFREVTVDQYVQCIGLYPVGTLVELASGEVGVVIQQNRVMREKPRLMVLMSADKTLKRRPTYIDLMLSPKADDGTPHRIVHALPSNAYGIDPAEFFLS